MSKILFQWDDGNRKHAIDAHPERNNTQDEIESLFDDPAFVAAPDPKHSEYEDRFNAVAVSNQSRVLFVVYIIRDGYIRPISCRPANRNERKNYDQTGQQRASEASERPRSLGDEERTD